LIRGWIVGLGCGFGSLLWIVDESAKHAIAVDTSPVPAGRPQPQSAQRHIVSVDHSPISSRGRDLVLYEVVEGVRRRISGGLPLQIDRGAARLGKGLQLLL